MKKDFTLNVPNPCDKSWNEMSITDSGKFCSHCSNEVVDFTKMSTEELTIYFQSNEKKVCGYIQQVQLNQFNKDLNIVPFWRGFNAKIAAASFIALLTTSKVVSAVSTIGNQSYYRLSNSQKLHNHIKNEIGIDSLFFIIRGVVKAKDDGWLMAGARVGVKSSKQSVSTDMKGVFNILVKGEVNEKVILSATYIGYKTFEFEVVLGKLDNKTIDVVLETQNFPMGEIVVVRKDTPSSGEVMTGTVSIVRASNLYIKKRPSFFRRLMNSIGRLF